jgi:hypothetical protein
MHCPSSPWGMETFQEAYSQVLVCVQLQHGTKGRASFIS